MMGKHCKLYDETLVRNIMISTGLSAVEFLRQHGEASLDDVCEFIEVNAEDIIETTIEDMNNCESSNEGHADDELPRVDGPGDNTD